MSGNSGDDCDREISNVLDRMSGLAKSFEEMRSQCDRYAKIIAIEFETVFSNIQQAIGQFMQCGNPINLKNALCQMNVYEKLCSCMMAIASTIIDMNSVLTVDNKLHEQRIQRVNKRLDDIIAKVARYSDDVAYSGNLVEIIIRDENVENTQNNSRIFDVKMDTFVTNTETCIDRVILVKEEIQNGSSLGHCKHFHVNES